MFHWVKDLAEPYPDFNTWHQCRDSNLILDWALDNAVPVAQNVKRKSGVVELEEAPY